MPNHLCIPPDVFERIAAALPHLPVEADESHQYLVADGVTFAAVLSPAGAA